MKKRLLIGSVLLVVLAALLPSLAMAAAPAPFNASGGITTITDGTVKPAGTSGRFVVVEREIKGTLAGDLSGSFTLAYKANVELSTQAGGLHGTVRLASGKVLNVNANIQPLEMAQVAPGVWLPKLSMMGHWNFTSGAQGQGAFTAWAVFIPDSNGHVVSIPLSDFRLTGKSQP